MGLRLVTTDLPYGSHPFAEKGGLVPWFTTRHMVYEGEPLPEPLSPIPYEDPWYRAYQDLIAQAFLPLRRAMDVPPHRMLPSVEDRFSCAQHRRDIFLFLKNRQLMGAVSLDESGLLNNLAVSPAFQGQGVGKAHSSFCRKSSFGSRPDPHPGSAGLERKKSSGSMKAKGLSPDPAAACTGGICPPKTDILQKALGITRVLRLSKNLYNEKGRPPYPYKSAKSRDLCVAFCTSQGRGAPLVRWPDGHTFFAFLHRTCPARERSMGAAARRQPLVKTRKSGLSHFFDTLSPWAALAQGLCYYAKSNPRYHSSPAGTGRPDTMAKGSFSPPRAWLQGGRRTWAL